MEAESALSKIACPACGGAGGGPFGRAGGAWDDEEYVCPRCEGAGAIMLDDVMVKSERPGIAKAIPASVDSPRPAIADPAQKKRKASA